ncbi:hypothetical protein LJC17_02210 [Acholeplasma sp. OttesenSCG-928-E16]|nr:hypothetical protein [Acholeplasma sp. OttesenSCG-928-E16]
MKNKDSGVINYAKRGVVFIAIAPILLACGFLLFIVINLDENTLQAWGLSDIMWELTGLASTLVLLSVLFVIAGILMIIYFAGFSFTDRELIIELIINKSLKKIKASIRYEDIIVIKHKGYQRTFTVVTNEKNYKFFVAPREFSHVIAQIEKYNIPFESN